jgi:hypothetical protein
MMKCALEFETARTAFQATYRGDSPMGRHEFERLAQAECELVASIRMMRAEIDKRAWATPPGGQLPPKPAPAPPLDPRPPPESLQGWAPV